eukprot:TRINITY_DN12622_c0_g1_i1.p1 TRINITY_DN12622_c0_g1~~TRINITY_DN12622_c0_g1_i1.p1  ORF type:complete len:228 (-),score=72.50 TRINITY_DN12622_c0_g1_i1:10-693(-)
MPSAAAAAEPDTSSLPKIYVVLVDAHLETGKVGKDDFQLLNCDDHKGLLSKSGRDPALYRPDITHQCLLTLLDSPLNKAGRLQVFIHTHQNMLIEVNPHIRIPRTFKRFCGLIVQLLRKMSIRGVDSTEKLMKIVRNPVTQHLPADAVKIACSHSADRLVDLREYIPQQLEAVKPPRSLVFVIGAFAHGMVNPDWTTETISFSNHQLSASVACARLCTTVEQYWGIL